MRELQWNQGFPRDQCPTLVWNPPHLISSQEWHIYQMSALGNRFLIIEEESVKPFAPAQQQILAIAAWDKGWDQLLTYKTDTEIEKQLVAKVWNRDGSRAENCGNGVRCLAALHMWHERANNRPFEKSSLTIIIPGNPSLKTNCEVSPIANSNNASVVSHIAKDSLDHKLIAHNSPEIVLIKSTIEGVVSAARVRYGNPHLVLFLADSARPEKEALKGKELEKQLRTSDIPFYRDGINISFAQINDNEKAHWQLGPNVRERIDLQVWERGVGLTDSCGSGAVAVFFAACEQKLVARDFVRTKNGVAFSAPHIALKPLALEIGFSHSLSCDMNTFRGALGEDGDFYLAGDTGIERAGVLHLDR